LMHFYNREDDAWRLMETLRQPFMAPHSAAARRNS
jgi:hypothetical protein